MIDIEKIRSEFDKTNKFTECRTLETKKERAKLNALYWAHVEESFENAEHWRGVVKGLEAAEECLNSYIDLLLQNSIKMYNNLSKIEITVNKLENAVDKIDIKA